MSVVSVENTWVHESLRCLGDLRINEKDLMKHISICNSLLKRNEPFLKNTIMDCLQQ